MSVNLKTAVSQKQNELHKRILATLVKTEDNRHVALNLAREILSTSSDCTFLFDIVSVFRR